MSLTSSGVFIVNVYPISHLFSVSIVDSEPVNVSWVLLFPPVKAC